MRPTSALRHFLAAIGCATIATTMRSMKIRTPFLPYSELFFRPLGRSEDPSCAPTARSKFLAISLGFLSACGLASGAADWHTFTSADGEKNFTARVISVNSGANTVTMEMKDRAKQITFSLSLLSEEDREKALADALARAAASSLRANFRTNMTQTGKSEKGDTTTTSYDGVCQVSLANSSSVTIPDVKVDYIVVWRSNSFDDKGEEQLVHGSETLSYAFAGLSQGFTTDPVKMKGVYKKGRTVSVGGGGGSCRSCPGSGGGTIGVKSQRSRDQLLGVIIQVKVEDRVVLTQASNRSLMKYRDEFAKDKEDR
jgi:hypothetical protein